MKLRQRLRMLKLRNYHIVMIRICDKAFKELSCRNSELLAESLFASENYFRMIRVREGYGKLLFPSIIESENLD